MAPTSQSGLPLSTAQTKASQAVDVDIAEAWGEGFQFGGLIILMLVVICNIKRHVLLHKLILIEQFLALWHATFIFFDDPIYGWYLSSTVVPLYGSYLIHNIVAWMKIRPFLSPRATKIYLGSLFFVEPYWIVALWTNFCNFNGLSPNHYQLVRPWEALAREPWWIFTTVYFVWVIKRGYSRGFWELAKASSRFGVLSFCMVASIAFAIVDAVLVFRNWDNSTGINPFWRISLVLKCASDTIFLDDFKKFLDSLVIKPFNNIGSQAQFHRGHELRTHDFVNLSSETECHNAIPNSSHQEFATYHSATIKDGPKNGSSKDIYRAVASPPHSPN